MERKTTQRIIGIFVATALVIILLPLLFNSKEAPTQTAAMNPPPFPDGQENTLQNQAINSTPAESVNPATAPEAQQPQTTAQNDAPAQPTTEPVQFPLTNNAQPNPTDSASAAPSTNTPAPATENNLPQTTASNDPSSAAIVTQEAYRPQSASPQQDATPNTTDNNTTATAEQKNPTIASNNTEAEAFNPNSFDIPGDETQTSPVSHTSAPTPATPATILTSATAPTIAQAKPLTQQHKPIVVSHNTTRPAQHNLTQYKAAAWVVQMGSFKSKTNAVHLANRLRAMGYKAFMIQSKSAQGEARTHVYVGPEFKRFTATALASKIEQDVNMRGIIVSYQPLEL